MTRRFFAPRLTSFFDSSSFFVMSTMTMRELARRAGRAADETGALAAMAGEMLDGGRPAVPIRVQRARAFGALAEAVCAIREAPAVDLVGQHTGALLLAELRDYEMLAPLLDAGLLSVVDIDSLADRLRQLALHLRVLAFPGESHIANAIAEAMGMLAADARIDTESPLAVVDSEIRLDRP